MMANLTPALFRLLGTLIGGTSSWLISRKRSQTSLTFDFHREFNNAEYSRARRRCYRLLKKYPNRDFEEISELEDYEPSADIWFIVRFYQRLWIAIKYKQLNTKSVPELFGENFFWWYVVHFEDKLLPIPCQASREIKQLKKWLDNNSSKSLRAYWLRLAQTSRQKQMLEIAEVISS